MVISIRQADAAVEEVKVVNAVRKTVKTMTAKATEQVDPVAADVRLPLSFELAIFLI